MYAGDMILTSESKRGGGYKIAKERLKITLIYGI